nr:penicillin-binding transpeptidase domain-containing protein [Pseudomonadota bacterium]
QEGAWRPQNSTERFYGPTTLRTALTKSINVVSIRLLREIGMDTTMPYLHRFGFTDAELPRNLTLALGTGEVTPLELTTAYSVFANGGYRVKPYFIDRIENDGGEVLYKEYPLTVCENCLQEDSNEPDSKHQHDPKFFPAPQVITPQNAYLITNVLQNVINQGTAKRALSLNRGDIAGKTGTTNDQFDAWFAGYNQQIVTTVWVGNDNPQSIFEYGAEMALPIWIDFMRTPLSMIPEQKWEMPAGIVSVRIDPASGLLANQDQQNSIVELFEQKNVPTEVAGPPQQAQEGKDDEGSHLFW